MHSITQEYYEIILILHSYRNKAYHQGIKEERIIHSLAIFYLITVCSILKDYKPIGISSSSTDKLSIRATKYVGKIENISGNFDLYNICFTRVLEVVGNLEYNLKDDLHINMNEIITENDTYINYLLDSPNTTDRNSVIIDCQLTAFVFSNEAKKFAKENGYSGKTVGEYVNWIKDNYSWKVKKDPIPKWNVRLNSLKGSKNNYEILKKYNDFILQTQDLRDNISKGVDAFDEYVNMQIDMAKGG